MSSSTPPPVRRPEDPPPTADPVVTEDPGRLRAIKTLHSLVWAFFVGSILGVWTGALLRRFDVAEVCIGLVGVEIVVLAVNRWQCPLTAIAARYTADRRPNFDIYLPEWVARWNKEIFGGLFLGGVLLVLIRSRG